MLQDGHQTAQQWEQSRRCKAGSLSTAGSVSKSLSTTSEGRHGGRTCRREAQKSNSRNLESSQEPNEASPRRRRGSTHIAGGSRLKHTTETTSNTRRGSTISLPDSQSSNHMNGRRRRVSTQNLNSLPTGVPVEKTMKQLIQDAIHESGSAIALDLKDNALRQVSEVPVFVRSIVLSANLLKSLKSLSSLQCLVELDVSKNKLRSLKGLYRSCKSLRTLNASSNLMPCIEGLETMESLRHLDIRENRLSLISNMRSLSCNLGLIELRIMGNPVSQKAQVRQVLMDLVPSLLLLDDRPVSVSPDVGPVAKEWSYSARFASKTQCNRESPLDKVGQNIFEEETEEQVRFRGSSSAFIATKSFFDAESANSDQDFECKASDAFQFKEASLTNSPHSTPATTASLKFTSPREQADTEGMLRAWLSELKSKERSSSLIRSQRAVEGDRTKTRSSLLNRENCDSQTSQKDFLEETDPIALKLEELIARKKQTLRSLRHGSGWGTTDL
mmetsp:Transcript_13246/g.24547  ORF Transcript_13246/g.24547 Transcript_13246/m.24547 type:complete len:501 (+) Transcript_13246:261-1763(+)